MAFATLGGPAHIHVPGGETGMLHFTIPGIVDFSVAPALGDIDVDRPRDRGAQLGHHGRRPRRGWRSRDGPGHAAVYNDGSLMWNSGLPPGDPQVADMDRDALPEVVLTNANGLALIEHDGTVTYQRLHPTGAPAAGLTWTRPATIHDFDGDGQAEVAMSSGNSYSVYETGGNLLWTSPVLDSSGVAAGTAFDFATSPPRPGPSGSARPPARPVAAISRPSPHHRSVP